MRKHSILIVDDEKNARDALNRLLGARYEVTLAEDGTRAVNLLRRHSYDVVLTDLKMPGADGMQVLAEALRKTPPPQCIVLTAYGTVQTAVEAVKQGAFDYIEKPLNLERVEIAVKRALESKALAEENKDLRRRLSEKFGPENIIGQSSSMHHIIETVKLVAPSRSTVLITGESGTGKELVAQAIHSLSGRRGAFVPVHCAALPLTLLESELFGHEKGAFTGAAERRKGRFELADAGTLFLDEISEIDQSVQVKILRALETRTFERVGGTEPVLSDTRVLAATNKDLMSLVSEGKFREDLFYRLYVVTINIPPLRDRKEDIPLLVKHYLDVFAKENGRGPIAISDDAMNALVEYRWPGNIRELRNCVERMVVLSRKNLLDIASVPSGMKQAAVRIKGAGTLSCNIHENESMLIQKALESSRGNISKASQILGISRRTLHRKLKKMRGEDGSSPPEVQ